jgi:hypothetical protein
MDLLLTSVASDEHFVYGVTQDLEFVVLDTSVSSSVKVIGSIPVQGANDLFVHGDYVFVATNTGVQVIDVRAPETLRITVTLSAPSEVRAATAEGNRAYLALGTGGLQIVDIATLHRPQVLGVYNDGGYYSDLLVSDSMVYAVGDEWFYVLDTRNPESTAVLGAWDSHFFGCNAAFRYEQSVYVACFNALVEVNVEDPAAPRYADEYHPDGYWIADVTVDNGHAYLALEDAGLEVVSLNSASMQPVGRYTQIYARGVAVHNKVAFLAGGALYDSQFFSVAPLSVNPTYADGYFTDGDAEALAIVGEYAYVPQRRGLAVMKIGLAGRPFKVGQLDLPGTVSDMLFHNGLGYVVGDAGLQTISLSIPSKPTILGSWPTLTVFTKVAVDGKYAYVEVEGSGVWVFDVGREGAPELVNEIPVYDISDVAAQSGHLYVASKRGLHIVDVRDPKHHNFVGFYGQASSQPCLAVRGDYAYLVGQQLAVIDIREPSHPILQGELGDFLRANDIVLSGPYAYVATVKGIEVIDVHESSRPRFATSGIYFDQSVDALAVTWNAIYAASEDLHVWNRMPFDLRFMQSGQNDRKFREYEVVWTDLNKESLPQEVKCQVSGGYCDVTEADYATNTAMVRWTLPSVPGSYDLEVGVGDVHRYDIAYDTAIVD